MRMEPSWQDPGALPLGGSHWATLNPLTGITRQGEDSVRRALRATNLLEPMLISTPETGPRLLPPAALPNTLGNRVRERILENRRRVEQLAWTYLILLPAALLLAGAIRLAVLWFCFNLLTALHLRSDRHRLANPGVIEARARYYAWLYWHARPWLVRIGILMVGAGALQLLAGQLIAGGNEVVLETFGLVHSLAAESRQLWRYAAGTLLHVSAAHWLANLVVGLILATLVGPHLKRLMLPMMLLTAILSFAGAQLAWTAGLVDTDGIVGLSGGLGGLLGILMAIQLGRPGDFPPGILPGTLWLAASSLVIVPVFSAPVTLACHLTGIVAGIACGVLLVHRGEPS